MRFARTARRLARQAPSLEARNGLREAARPVPVLLTMATGETATTVSRGEEVHCGSAQKCLFRRWDGSVGGRHFCEVCFIASGAMFRLMHVSVHRSSSSDIRV